ncbi:Os06g0575700 [Oryza sativa Japonica Group]|uniref:Os06g0575700 protein n=2 Tax=Oryza TaxID=4527 RepID=A0A0N7KMB5_ORYSJ|nr:Os06g0575700 [Oryza sativa Japonica Group]
MPCPTKSTGSRQQLALALFTTKSTGSRQPSRVGANARRVRPLVDGPGDGACPVRDLSMLVLDGMYSHSTAESTAANAHAFYGSASSVALRLPHHRTKGIEISNLIEAEFKAERTLEASPSRLHACSGAP